MQEVLRSPKAKEEEQETIREAERELYESTAPQWKQRLLENYIQLKAVFWKSLSFGLLYGYKIIYRSREEAYHRYALEYVRAASGDILKVKEKQ